MAVADGLCGAWGSMTEAEKLQAMKETINETLKEMGFSPVNVELDDLDENFGEYDWDTDTVILDKDHVNNDSLASVLDTAYHEAAHAIEDQDGFYESLTDEERDDYTDQAMVFVADGDDFIRVMEPFHDEVRQFAEYETEQAMAPCAEQGAESASDDEPWEFSIEDLENFDPDRTGNDYEIEFGEPIIRDEPTSDDEWTIEMGDPIIRNESDVRQGGSNLETPPGPGTAGSGP